ncbi:hypothetical protein CE143_02990 [Photorhabdus luminescens]|uniref:DUF1240 domain-containing protein n=1 Tax=Photorhabdus akhurstii TaxID=171438 RepID=A0ABX8LP75_9GAMM|nr:MULTISPECIES: DUF1240 domain-containing protein [Photorhabdus]KGM27415.1 membrane protein [Photorhabdus luminescens]MBS9431602.1 DUF1240 domain-containing protein [Photorhabdus hainanensis]NRN28188.1 DUF1240 domain-containing protein [Photorhabdus heterorhabditis subsp. aluminescens]MBS9429396.1 DUF1240 domain-containing protein [Photorhabdus akhurstii]PQQ32116.1 DUF1240 domain-containing protein [Photorhabdus luminescens]
MNSKYLKALGGVILLLFLTFLMCFIIKSAVSLVLMKDEITFSSAVIISILSFPIIFYSLSGSIFFFIFDRLPKYNKILVKYLSRLMIASFVISLPISFYVDYKLKNDGYLTCDKISWMSPTTYVKNLLLCK